MLLKARRDFDMSAMLAAVAFIANPLASAAGLVTTDCCLDRPKHPQHYDCHSLDAKILGGDADKCL